MRGRWKRRIGLAASLLALGSAGPAAAAQLPGRLTLISVEEPADEGLRSLLTARGGQRVELVLESAPDPDEPDAENAQQRADAGAADDSEPDGTTRRVRLRAGDPSHASDRELETLLRRAETIVLSGGSLLEWYEVFSPRRHSSGLRRGLVRGLRGGADVIGLGGAAAYLAGASLVPWDDLERERRNPRDRRSHIAVVGMGLGPRAIVETEPRGGELGLLLLTEMLRTGVDLGLRMEGEVALTVDWNHKRYEVAGPGQIVVLDVDGAREDRGHLSGARLSVLLAGDVWDVGHRQPLPGPRRELVARAAPGGAAVLIADPELAAGLGLALGALAGPGTERVELVGPFGRLVAGSDARSRRWRGPDGTSLHLLTLAVTPPAPHR